MICCNICSGENIWVTFVKSIFIDLYIGYYRWMNEQFIQLLYRTSICILPKIHPYMLHGINKMLPRSVYFQYIHICCFGMLPRLDQHWYSITKWIIHGLFMDYLWIIHELFIIHLLFMDYLWIIYGLFMEFSSCKLVARCTALLPCSFISVVSFLEGFDTFCLRQFHLLTTLLEKKFVLISEDMLVLLSFMLCPSCLIVSPLLYRTCSSTFT